MQNQKNTESFNILALIFKNLLMYGAVIENTDCFKCKLLHLEESKDILFKLLLCYLILYFKHCSKGDTYLFTHFLKSSKQIILYVCCCCC